MLRKSFAHLLKYIKPNISHNKFFDLTSQFSHQKRMLGSCPKLNSIQYISQKVNPLPQRSFESEVLSQSSSPKEAIEDIRRAIQYCVSDKELSELGKIHYRELRM